MVNRKRQAGVLEVAQKPTKAEIRSQEREVCHAMTLVGVEVLTDWRKTRVHGSCVADLVSRVYASMHAQRIILEGSSVEP